MNPMIQRFQNVNLTKLVSFSGDDEQFIFRMIDLFKQEIPKSVRLLRRFTSDGDFNGIQAVAHELKSSVDLMGIEIYTELNEIESLAGDARCLERISHLSNIVINKCDYAIADLHTITVKDLSKTLS